MLMPPPNEPVPRALKRPAITVTARIAKHTAMPHMINPTIPRKRAQRAASFRYNNEAESTWRSKRFVCVVGSIVEYFLYDALFHEPESKENRSDRQINTPARKAPVVCWAYPSGYISLLQRDCSAGC